MKILITGGAGYIGSILALKLLTLNYEVKIYDNLMVGGNSLLPLLLFPNFEFVNEDIRHKDKFRHEVAGVDWVVHLAALVGHRLCERNPSESWEINYESTLNVYDICNNLGIKRMVFVSTCSNYGITEAAGLADEDSKLNPISLYAQTKVAAEENLLKMASTKTSICILRFATIFGLSPRMRFDLMLNEFVRDAIFGKKIIIYNPLSWRPFLHVQDAARAIIHVLTSPLEKIHKEIYNIGIGNYQKIELAQKVQQRIPEVEIVIQKQSEDNRNYQVSFNKMKKKLKFFPKYQIQDGIEEIRNLIQKKIIENPYNPIYTSFNK